MKCPYCSKEAKLVTGEFVHPFQPRYKDKYYYICDACDAYVGCHKGTKKALGTLANYELRVLRMKVHHKFDPLWRSKVVTRKDAYIILSKKLNISLTKCHIAAFDIDTCNRVLGIIECG